MQRKTLFIILGIVVAMIAIAAGIWFLRTRDASNYTPLKQETAASKKSKNDTLFDPPTNVEMQVPPTENNAVIKNSQVDFTSLPPVLRNE